MTLDPRTIELIQAYSDGELGQDQARMVEDLLDSSPQARTLHDELRQLEEQLAAEPDPVPPAALSGQILDAWKHSNRTPSVLFSLFSPFRPAAVGLAFATGLLLTVAVYEWIPGKGVALDPRSMAGTMVATPVTGELDSLTLREEGLSGQVTLRGGQGDVLLLLLDFETEQALEAEISLAGDARRVGGIVVGENSGALQEITIGNDGGRLHITDPGRQTITVILPGVDGMAEAPRTITITFSRNGQPLYSGSLSG